MVLVKPGARFRDIKYAILHHCCHQRREGNPHVIDTA